jgi:hypothetical protein
MPDYSPESVYLFLIAEIKVFRDLGMIATAQHSFHSLINLHLMRANFFKVKHAQVD